MIAHVGGLPVEEVLQALMTGAGACLVLRLTSLWYQSSPASESMKTPTLRAPAATYIAGDAEDATSMIVHSGGPVSAPASMSLTT